MTTSEALMYLLCDIRSPKLDCKAQFRGTCHALDVLGVYGKDRDVIMRHLGFYHPDTNQPYERFTA